MAARSHGCVLGVLQGRAAKAVGKVLQGKAGLGLYAEFFLVNKGR